MTGDKVVSRGEWLIARKALRAREKELTRLRDEVSAERRALPRVKVEKEYVFETPDGKKTLADLCDGRSQLIVYHFMFDPDDEEGCPYCSFLADHIDGANLHLAHHDVTLLVVSRAPIQKIKPFKKRMGWQFTWVSSYESDFNYDYHVSPTKDDLSRGKVFYDYDMRDLPGGEMPGTSVFYKDENGDIFHTYSAYARGGEPLLGAYSSAGLKGPRY
ncbi:MAG: DUF899 domain-containing protein [Luteitalea sp.]|nr:DUF899 domain-containing protein [Luteitalea sp.]